MIPKGSKILGHISQAVTKGKNRPESALAIVIDKVVQKQGSEIPLQAIIAAVAAPKDNSLSSDPTYGMLHSNEPKASGAGAAAASRSGELSASSKASATAVVIGKQNAVINAPARVQLPFAAGQHVLLEQLGGW